MFVQLGNMGLELNTIQRGDTVEKFLNRNGKTIEGFEDIASIATMPFQTIVHEIGGKKS